MMSSKAVEAIANLRQLCMGTIKVYRSSFPDNATENDVKYLKETLGIKLIIDFRAPNEGSSPLHLRDVYKKVVVGEEELENMKEKCTTDEFLKKEMPYVHLNLGFISKKYNRLIHSLLTEAQKKELVEKCPSGISKYLIQNIINPRGIKQQYMDFIDNSQIFIYTMLKLLSDPDHVPALIHCMGGKDRTGISSALIHTCVGLSREHIIEDYEATTEGMKDIYDEIYKGYVEVRGMDEEFLTSKRETMAATLDYIDQRYGSAQEYLTKCGFSVQEQEKLKENLMIKTNQQ